MNYFICTRWVAVSDELIIITTDIWDRSNTELIFCAGECVHWNVFMDADVNHTQFMKGILITSDDSQ